MSHNSIDGKNSGVTSLSIKNMIFCNRVFFCGSLDLSLECGFTLIIQCWFSVATPLQQNITICIATTANELTQSVKHNCKPNQPAANGPVTIRRGVTGVHVIYIGGCSYRYCYSYVHGSFIRIYLIFYDHLSVS